MSVRLYFMLPLLMTLMCQRAWPGTLSDFATDVHQSKPTSSPVKSQNHGVEDACASMITEEIVHGMAYGGSASLARINASAGDALDMDVRPRESGESLLPFVRLDASYQRVKSDVHAFDYSLEGGYGPVALRFNQSHFSEQEPEDTLDVFRFYGLYRMSFGDIVETDIGAGVLALKGDDRSNRFSLTLPILIHPMQFVGIEFRPAWADHISEYDIGLLLGVRYGSVKMGYRWLNGPNETLDGPYAGMSVCF